MTSPYENIHVDKWREKTEELVSQHPLSLEDIRETAIKCWNLLWKTTIGTDETAIKLVDIDVPATVVGYFFEKLLARELEIRYPSQWRGNLSKDEKDLVYIADERFSIEVKSSGQLGTKIYGNRSYSKKPQLGSEASKPEKSGYYLTVNFYGQILMLLRFGWIDLDDWTSQASETGQAASLKSEVYQKKLLDIRGDYRLKSPVSILSGVGPKKLEMFKTEGVSNIHDLLRYEGDNPTLQTFKSQCQEFLTK